MTSIRALFDMNSCKESMNFDGTRRSNTRDVDLLGIGETTPVFTVRV